MGKHDQASNDTMLDNDASTEAETAELIREMTNLTSSGFVSSLLPETREKLKFALNALSTKLNCIDQQMGESAEQSPLATPIIGMMYSLFGPVVWDKELKTFGVNYKPAFPNCVLAHIHQAQEDVKKGEALSTYANPAYRSGNPLTNADLTALEEHVSICSRGDVRFVHSSPGLDMELTAETEDLLHSRQLKPGL
jgi:hypothetical protein